MNEPAKLTKTQVQELVDSIHSFRHWLSKVLPNAVIADYDGFSCVPPTEDDWIMLVDRNKKLVQFNPDVAKNCSLAYYEMIVIHECFHLFVQDLPNKSDARLVTTGFGESMMKMLDIEADYFTALYLKDVKRASLVDVIAHYSEGSRVFGNPDIITPKLERFIGTILSVCNAFFQPRTRNSLVTTEIYIPKIKANHREETLHVIVSKSSYSILTSIRANAQDFANLRRAYTNTGGLTDSEYVSLVVNFAAKALDRDIPVDVNQQLKILARAEA